MSSSTVRVKLHPFVHQVGGSSLMFKLNSHTICKPLLPKEYEFYEFLPGEMKEFTAAYKGSIEVIFEEETDGICNFYGLLSKENVKLLDLNSATIRYRRVHETDIEGSPRCDVEYIDFLHSDSLTLKAGGSIEMNADSLEYYDEPNNKINAGLRLYHNLNTFLHSYQHRFILLENLVADFEHPSILDLKMGTRTYSDDDSELRKLKKQKRAENSTSMKLGARVNGMQKYDAQTGKYKTIDRYDGHKVSEQGFKHLMKEFLDNGRGVRKGVASSIVSRLREYYDCVANIDTVRFYSSSLLIMYDGSPANSQPLVDVKAIDFADIKEQLSSPESAGPDLGYLQGIKTLIDIFSDISSSYPL